MEKQRDLEAVGVSMREALERLRPSEDSFLPAAVVEMQRFLALFKSSELNHIIVAVGVQLAARAPGATTPDQIVEAALPHLRKLGAGEQWLLRVRPEIVRLTELARDASGFFDDESQVAES